MASIHRAARGQVLPSAALALVALLGMAALAVDVGYWRYEQRLTQTAADSAAMAGGIELNYSQSASSVTAAARKDASTNGFTDDGGKATSVTVNWPPKSGPYSGSSGAVEVIVTKKQPVFFDGVYGNMSRSVSAQAVSAENSSGRTCIYGLSRRARR